MIAKVTLFIACLLLSGPTPKQNILFFGDSLTAGYGLSPEQAFPALVQKRLLSEGYTTYNVINAGLSGETSSGGLSRIDWILRQPVEVFILELGANDGLRGLPPEQTEKNLQAIIDKVRAKNPKVKIIIAGMMVPPNMGKVYTDKFQKVFPAIAKRNGAVFIPFILDKVAGIKNLNQSDGIHPTAEGHKIVAENVFKWLSPMLAKK